MAGVINIKFTQQPSVGDKTAVRVEYLTNLGTYEGIRLRFEWVNTRTRSGQIEIGGTLLQTVNNFAAIFSLDHVNTGGDLNITTYKPSVGALEVNVNVNADNWRWNDIIQDTYYLEYTVNNSNTETPKTANFTGYDDLESTCAYPAASFDVTGGSGIYNVYVNGSLEVNAQASQVKVPLLRNTPNTLRITDTLGEVIAETNVRTPRRIIQDDIGLQINNSPNGATVSFDVAFISPHLLPLEYSIDDLSYSEENVLTGQPAGTYTVYVKDVFGCKTSKVYTLDGDSTVTEVIFKTPSEINPFRWARVEDGKKNRYNTLSFNQVKDVPYIFSHLVLEDDEPINQIKTNAKYLKITALDCYGGESTELSPIKRSNHIGRHFKSTATQISTENDLLGLYFGAVDVLDILTDEFVDSKDYVYQIPSAFDAEGRFIDVSGFGKLPVQSILYDEGYEAFVLQFNVAYTGQGVPVTASAKYNMQNYEIYEFLTPVSILSNKFQVLIEAGNSEDDISHVYVSEIIERTEDSENLKEIVYWNTTNIGSMNYATGISHKIRLHSVLSRLADEQTVEGYNGDVERYNTSQEIFDGEEFLFGHLTDEMVRKIRTILAHDRLFINGVLFRLGETPELNSRYTTNLCELTALLKKGGDITDNFDSEIINPGTGEGVDEATYELEQAIAAAKGKALILWKK